MSSASVRQNRILADVRVVIACRVQADGPAVADLRPMHDGAMIDPTVVANDCLIGNLGQRPTGRLGRAATLNVDVVVDMRVVADKPAVT